MDSHGNSQVLFVFVLFVSLLFFFASLSLYIGISHEIVIYAVAIVSPFVDGQESCLLQIESVSLTLIEREFLCFFRFGRQVKLPF